MDTSTQEVVGAMVGSFVPRDQTPEVNVCGRSGCDCLSIPLVLIVRNTPSVCVSTTTGSVTSHTFLRPGPRRLHTLELPSSVWEGCSPKR